jgi:ABC-2 type transport system permease protein
MTGTLDFSPAPGAAPAASRVVRHGLMEATLLVRNGEQLLLALIIPVGVLVVGRYAAGRLGGMSQLAPSVLALGVWSSAFTSVAISTGFERRYGVLERLAATPLGRSGLLAGKSLALVLIIVDQLVVLGITAALLGWRPAFTVPSALVALALVIVATAAFACLALLLAGRLRAEATLGLANLIYVVLLAGGALVIPLSRYPAAVRPVVELLPTAALGEGLRAAAAGHVLGWPFVVLAAWLLVAAAGAWKGFRWTS